MSSETVKILMVCLGNICRSPTAEVAFRQEVANRELTHLFDIDSAGTGTWHIGEKPDVRARTTAAKRNMDLESLKARTVSPDDFHHFDYIFAMDTQNLNDLKAMEPVNAKANIELFLTWPDKENGQDGYQEVPDPFYSKEEDFELVLDLVEAASKDILDYIADTHQLT
ncbi:low molecular weight phosphotyrosine protein phosphatase [Gammaproteobacteria bacterium]|jgi:protein-tyrosine phosphatase|nr:low molecular weight phosphotyrosine protein phosphatase [Gammaproteobacteria bacterium]